MDGVIQKYKDIIQSERENSRKRKSSQQLEEQEPAGKLAAKPARKTMEQSLGATDFRLKDANRQQEAHSLGGGGWVENQPRESTTSSQLSATPRRTQFANKDTESERGLQTHMVQKATKSILEVVKAHNLAEKEKITLIEQIIFDLIGPTFDTMRDLEEKVRAAHLHAMLKDSFHNEPSGTAKNHIVSEAKMVLALEQRVQELSREKSDLETQLILCKKDLEHAKERGRQATPLKLTSDRDSQSLLNDKLLEAHDCLIKSNNILREQLELKETEFREQRKLWDSQLQQVMSLIDSTKGKPNFQLNINDDSVRSGRTTLVHSQHNLSANSNSLYTSPRPRGHQTHLPPAPQINSPGSK